MLNRVVIWFVDCKILFDLLSNVLLLRKKIYYYW